MEKGYGVRGYEGTSTSLVWDWGPRVGGAIGWRTSGRRVLMECWQMRAGASAEPQCPGSCRLERERGELVTSCLAEAGQLFKPMPSLHVSAEESPFTIRSITAITYEKKKKKKTAVSRGGFTTTSNALGKSENGRADDGPPKTNLIGAPPFAPSQPAPRLALLATVPCTTPISAALDVSPVSQGERPAPHWDD